MASAALPFGLELLLVGFIVLGFVLKLTMLLQRGQSYDIDQAVILYWGLKFWQGGEPFRIFGPEFTHWEMLVSYGAGFLDYIRVNPLWFPLALSCLEVVLIGFLGYQLGGRSLALGAMAFLSVSPWHLFFSSIVGTCVGPAVWAILTLLSRAHGIRSLIGYFLFLLLGLHHYSTGRIFLFSEALFNFFRRGWKEILTAGMSLIGFLGLTYIFQPELWTRALFRGGVHVGFESYNPWLSIPRGILFLFTPSWEHWIPALQVNVDMELSRALIALLPKFDTPLSWPGTVLLALGLWYTVRPSSHPLHRIGFIVLLSMLVLSPWSSFARLLWLLPFIALLQSFVLGFNLRTRMLGVLALAWLSIVSIQTLRDGAKPSPRDYFTARIPEALLHRPENATVAFLFSPYAYVESRYWAERSGSFLALTPDSPAKMEEQVRLFMQLSKTHEAWIWIDQFVDPDPRARNLPGMAQLAKNAFDWIRHLKTHAEVLEEKEVSGSIAPSVWLKIRWPSP